MGDYRTSVDGPPTLILGYAQMTEDRMRNGIRELADAVRRSPRTPSISS
jgi:DNA-binding transcriptional MocR family regulator